MLGGPMLLSGALILRLSVSCLPEVAQHLAVAPVGAQEVCRIIHGASKRLVGYTGRTVS